MSLSRHIRDERGFTLAEGMIVLIVFGILVALAVPSFSHFVNSSRLSGITNELVGDIHFTRSLAISKRRTHHIEFDVNEYRVVETASGNTLRTRTYPTGYNCVASADPNFFAWGLADPINITVNGIGAQNRALVLAANGNVHQP